MPESFRTLLDKDFADRRLIIVTNREPYIHKKTATGVKVDTPAGGVTAALDDVLKTTGGVWIAWGSGTADREVVNKQSEVEVPPDSPSYSLKRVWLTPSDVDNYYHGYSNRLLWPLSHIAMERVFFRKRFWHAYRRVNRLFADSVLEVIKGESDDLLWVHDYHLCLVPRLIREQLPDITISHFWHIPWPDWSVFRVCPQARELVEGLLGSDLLGFQIPLFVRNFMDCVRELLPEAEIDHHRQRIIYNGQTTELRAYPISIDFDKFDKEASKKTINRTIASLKRQYNIEGQFIGIGVDRLEYTKALIKRLQAIELFFEKYKRFLGRFTFVQIVTATRMKEPYLSYKKAVEDIVEKINKKYRRDHWKPVLYIEKKLSFHELVSFYRMADVGIVSSIYDGMNLVAKEFIASQVDCKGVLILSELAGAAEELDGAVLINPYDVEGFAEQIYRALRMPPDERRQRMESLRALIREKDIYRWITDVLSDMVDISGFKNKKCTYLKDVQAVLNEKVGDRKVFMFLDFDGTLTPIVETPEKAVLSEQMRDTLKRLSEVVPVAVISGRGLDDLRERVAVDGIYYAGNHGAEIYDGENVIISRETELERQRMKELIKRLKDSLGDIDGVILEDKGITTSVHFRRVKVKELSRLVRIFKDIIRDYSETFRVTTGKKVFEIRPLSAWNKGEALQWILQRYGDGRIPIYLGDDVTDEDAFKVVQGRGISIGVGLNCRVDYYLKDYKEVREFLEEVIRWLRR